MKNFMHFLKQHSIEITIISMIVAVSAVLYCIYPVSAAIFVVFCLGIQACAYKSKQQTETEQQITEGNIYNCYLQTAGIAYCIFMNFNYVGFDPVDKYNICYPNDYYHINKQGFLLFRYKCLLKTPIEIELEKLRHLINEVNDGVPYYQGLYVLQITQQEGLASLIVIYRNETTEQYIRDFEQRMQKKMQIKKADTSDQDF